MPNAEDLTKAWAEGTLKQPTVRDYLQRNLGALKFMPPRALDHVSNLCFALYEWSSQGKPCGDFLSAVIENDLTKAAHTADDVNMRNLWIYPAFLYNVAPTGWKDRKDEKTS